MMHRNAMENKISQKLICRIPQMSIHAKKIVNMMLNRLIFGSVHTLLTGSGECYRTRFRQIAADGIYVVRVEDRRLGYSHEKSRQHFLQLVQLILRLVNILLGIGKDLLPFRLEKENILQWKIILGVPLVEHIFLPSIDHITDQTLDLEISSVSSPHRIRTSSSCRLSSISILIFIVYSLQICADLISCSDKPNIKKALSL